jgi:hypothetical protein
VRVGALERGGLRSRGAFSPRARQTPPEGALRPRARRTPPEGCVTLERGGPYSRGVYPLSEADLTRGAFRCAALASRRGRQGRGRVVPVF